MNTARNLSPFQVQKRTTISVLLALIFIALTNAWLFHLGQQRLDYFDMSSFMDAMWRVSSGQKVYSDFAYNAGPVHLYIGALTIKLFGFNTFGVLTAMLLGNTLVLLSVFFLSFRITKNPIFSGLTVVVAGMSFYGPVAHPWYDQDAWLFIYLGHLALYGLLWQPVDQASGPLRYIAASIAVGVSVATAFLCKANIGVFAGIALGLQLIMLVPRPKILASTLICFMAFVFALGAWLLTLKEPYQFYYQTLVAYQTRDRLTNWVYLQDLFQGHTLKRFVWFSPLFAMYFYSTQNNKSGMLVTASFLVAIAGLLSTWTGSMPAQANLTALGLCFALAAGGLVFYQSKASKPLRFVSLSLVVISSCYFIKVGYQRSSQVLTWNWRPSNLQNSYTLASEPFRGWKSHERYGKAFDWAFQFINAQIPQHESLFIYPDMTFLYGATKRPSFPGSFLFHVGVFPPPGQVADQFTARFMASPPTWIILHETFEMTQITNLWEGLKSLGLYDLIKTKYEVLKEENGIYVLKRTN